MTVPALKTAIEMAAEALVAHEDPRPGLVAEGFPEPVAVRVAVFVPLAFGRAALADDPPKFAGHYLLEAPSGERTRHAFLDEPSFTVALALARSWLSSRPVDAQMVAGHSSEVSCVLDLTRGGGRPGDIVLVEPVLLGVGPPAEMGDIPNPPAEVGDTPKPPADEPSAKRPWWRFWR
jgi:hypothetical protein